MRILLLNTVNERFSLRDVNSRPMRGSEQAWAYLSHELAQLSEHTVDSVFKSERLPRERYDTVIAHRELDGLQHINARIKVLWVHNPPRKDFTQRCQRFLEYGFLDRIIVSTQYHRSTYNRDEYFKDKDNLFLLMDNGLSASLLEDFTLEKANKKKQFLYASAPHRGLGQFIKIWPKLHQQLPEYSFHIAGHLHLYSEQFKSNNHKLYTKIKEVVHQLGQMPNVCVHNKLNRNQYCQLMASSDALLYPCQTLEETSCITAHEALALGCVPIVSSAGALPEVVLEGITGRVVNGRPKKFLKHQDDPASIEFRHRFVDTVIETVKSQGLPRLRQQNNAQIHSWSHQARTLLDQLLEIVENSPQRNLFLQIKQFGAKITL